VVQKQRTFKNYRELLAQERAETERKFMLKLLAREEAKTLIRRHKQGGLAGLYFLKQRLLTRALECCAYCDSFLQSEVICAIVEGSVGVVVADGPHFGLERRV
jgi:hypothetical protein